MSILTAARISRAQIAALSAIGVFWGCFAAWCRTSNLQWVRRTGCSAFA